MRRIVLQLTTWSVVLGLGYFPARGDEKSKGSSPFGMTRRIPWNTSRLTGSPEPPPPYRLRRIYPKVKFQSPVCLAQEPGTNRLTIAENGGKIYTIPIDDQTVSRPELFLDVKRSLYAFSFHPNYRENGYLFTFSPTPQNAPPDGQRSRVSRFQVGGDHPRRVKQDSEKVIIEWPAGGHNGGEAIFGPDGFLYISTGDGTGGSDVNNTGQGINDLFSVIMRIDVDHPEPGKSYTIPRDNPFVNFPGARPEIWAFGFRNPWRMSFDFETGRLWVGDVGQDLWEMIWDVRKGGNYGWSVQEGSHPFHPHKKTGPGPILPPVVEHHHTECRSITGGYVYRGSMFPELRGAYIYGDYQYGKMWMLRYDGGKVTHHAEIVDSAVYIASFLFPKSGEILAIDNSSGFIHALERTPPELAKSQFPRKLSETGLYLSVPERKLAPGVIAYGVNAEGWADSAHVERHFALPGTKQFSDPNSWGYPDGMVIMQTLSLDLEQGNPRSRTPVESRILLKQDDHWMGYSYLWNETRADATLVSSNGAQRVLTIKDPSSAGGTRQSTWQVPGRQECMFCHSRAAGFVLGVKTAQMNRDFDYGGVVDNQIRALDHIGMFTTPLAGSHNSLPRMIDPYEERGDLEARARSYLHVNCSICHVSDGGGNSYIELDLGRKLGDTRTIGGKPVQGTFGIKDAEIIAPGEPERSVLYYRISSLGGARMPRVGSHTVDEKALALFRDWIGRLPGASKGSKDHRAGTLTDAESLILSNASKPGPEERTRLIARLTATTNDAIRLANWLDQGSIRSTARREIIAAVLDQSTAEIRDLFERFIPESQRIRRLGDTIDPTSILSLKGDGARGKEIFAAGSIVNCKSCHRLGGVGSEVGPDLSRIGTKYPRNELLRHLIEPNLSIDPKFTLYVLGTRDGRVHTGLIVRRDEREIVIRDAQNQDTRFATDQVENLEPQKQSLMPEFLLRSLTHQQAADLIEYLCSLR